MGFGSGGSSTSSIAGASDATLNNPTNNEVLTYDGSTSMWKNAESGGSITWSNIQGKPAVIAAGENAEAARAAIGAKHVQWTPDYIDLLPGQPLMVYYDETNGWPASRPVSRVDVPILCVDPSGGAAPNPSWVVLGRDIILVADIEEVSEVTPIATYTFENQANGQPLNINSASRPWSADSGDATPMIAATAAAVHGTLGGRVSSATSYRRLSYWEAQTNNTRVFDCYFTVREMGASIVYIMSARGDGGGTSVTTDVRLNLDRTVSLRNNTSAVATSVTALSLNTTYRFAYKVVSGQTQELRVYVGESTTPLFVLSGVVSGSGVDRCIFGASTASAGFSIDLDTVRIADDWLTPYA